jgi:hypothetical protein
MNQYQALAEDVDNATVAPNGEQDVIINVESDDEELGSDCEESNTKGPREDASETLLSEDLNISYGTIQDDAESFVDSIADVHLLDSPVQTRPVQATVTRAGTLTDIDDEFPVSEAKDKELQMKEIATVTLQRITEAQNELKRMRVDSPQKTSKSSKPDAGERADTGVEK